MFFSRWFLQPGAERALHSVLASVPRSDRRDRRSRWRTTACRCALVLVNACCVLGLVSNPGRAWAQEPLVDAVKEAGELFTQGRAEFDGGQYEAAAEHFERADELAPSADALTNAIAARLKAGQFGRAATLAVLVPEREPLTPEMTQAARSLLERARLELLEVLVECTERCSVLVGRRVIHGGPRLSRTVYLDPGDYEVYAAFGEQEAQSKTASGVAGASVTLEFEPAPKAKPLAEPEPELAPEVTEPEDEFDDIALVDTGGLPPAVFWTTAAATGVLAGVSIWSGIDTQNNPGASAVRAACESGAPNCQDLFDQGESKEKRTNLLWVATGAMAVTSAIIGLAATNWQTNVERDAAGNAKRRAARGVMPWLGASAQGAAVGARGSF